MQGDKEDAPSYDELVDLCKKLEKLAWIGQDDLKSKAFHYPEWKQTYRESLDILLNAEVIICKAEGK